MKCSRRHGDLLAFPKCKARTGSAGRWLIVKSSCCRRGYRTGQRDPKSHEKGRSGLSRLTAGIVAARRGFAMCAMRWAADSFASHALDRLGLLAFEHSPAEREV